MVDTPVRDVPMVGAMTDRIEEARGRVAAILANCVEESEYGDDGEFRMALEAIDALVLAVHVGACRETSGDGYSGSWSYCGDGFLRGRHGVRIDLATIWYCDDAREIRELRAKP
jgi:hypothetical protein